ncbi:rhodanese-related sulfurtransferase [Flavobacterium sp. CG_9.1]|jgi:rhodanese-related sulfurtransferase|uniref:Rhodanese-related sulfurtransferase n=3 Tax=Flavobacterium TaxID=237 RepID=A0A1M7J339_9FLAO|nr:MULTISPECIES: rhodanese-like domain-containing protein [Flavobacterium]MBC7748143.1 rhodanese-like domain-containing protein [Flavobacterium sp.]MBG6063000.1 rhodanese-related sulfurtransferase [Flavobacterium sp. CG_9.1]SDH54564.1 Rhodanese-related sulfurtransferase [Flavobacterium omnivorum]SHM46747.1 Rhodanese-related sulfurtransferase [Flavobacterium xanthum]
MFGIFKNIFSKKDTTQMEKLIKEGAFLVDVRTPAEFAEGHVKGSTNIPLDQVPNQLAQFKGKDQIIVFCRSGNRSGQAKMILERNGFKNVTNGGTWQDVNEVLNS